MNDALLTVQEVAEYLQVDEQTVYKWTSDEETPPKDRLPSIRLGGVIRFKKVDIDSWLEEHKQQKGRKG